MVGIVTLVLAAVNWYVKTPPFVPDERVLTFVGSKLFVITLIFDRVYPCAAGNVEARGNAVDDKEIDMKNLEA